jgi:hypothetical protein
MLARLWMRLWMRLLTRLFTRLFTRRANADKARQIDLPYQLGNSCKFKARSASHTAASAATASDPTVSTPTR